MRFLLCRNDRIIIFSDLWQITDIHNTIFVIQNGVKRNEESIENQWDSSFVGMTKLLYFQTYGKLRTFNYADNYLLSTIRNPYILNLSGVFKENVAFTLFFIQPISILTIVHPGAFHIIGRQKLNILASF